MVWLNLLLLNLVSSKFVSSMTYPVQSRGSRSITIQAKKEQKG